MPAIEAILFTISAGFTVIVIATILVIIGVRDEERRRTLTRQHPPTITSLLARRVLGTYTRQPPRKLDEQPPHPHARGSHRDCH
jgi:hypothetical protein